MYSLRKAYRVPRREKREPRLLPRAAAAKSDALAITSTASAAGQDSGAGCGASPHLGAGTQQNQE
jgi:hypothetical protein